MKTILYQGRTVDELREADANNEESDDDHDGDKIDFNLVAKNVLNHAIDELIEAESLLKASDNAKINWEANSMILFKPLKKTKKAESEEEREDATNDYSTDTLMLSFLSALNH